MEDRWFRVTCDFVMNLEHHIYFGASGSSGMPWLSQANHVFSRLGITSNFEDYILLSYIFVEITVSPTIPRPPKGYLFLCPPEQFHIGPSTSSNDQNVRPIGLCIHRGLNGLVGKMQLVSDFPVSEFWSMRWGYSWDSSVYEGLRQFHRAKGFDPDSQELALHLGEPLYELSSQTNPPFAHFHEEEHSAGGGSIQAPADSDDESEDMSSQLLTCIMAPEIRK
ncbi:hypothetical protein B0H14DRAFT_443508 [Mycena olivaceomarginata]|nr:hypothetical protein B0H14DRAFT_443508 [Mycena olivaceomarginata]